MNINILLKKNVIMGEKKEEKKEKTKHTQKNTI